MYNKNKCSTHDYNCNTIPLNKYNSYIIIHYTYSFIITTTRCDLVVEVLI